MQVHFLPLPKKKIILPCRCHILGLWHLWALGQDRSQPRHPRSPRAGGTQCSGVSGTAGFTARVELSCLLPAWLLQAGCCVRRGHWWHAPPPAPCPSATCDLVLFSLPFSHPAGPGTGRVDNGSMSLAVPLWLLAASLLCLLSKC